MFNTYNKIINLNGRYIKILYSLELHKLQVQHRIAQITRLYRDKTKKYQNR